VYVFVCTVKPVIWLSKLETVSSVRYQQTHNNDFMLCSGKGYQCSVSLLCKIKLFFCERMKMEGQQTWC